MKNNIINKTLTCLLLATVSSTVLSGSAPTHAAYAPTISELENHRKIIQIIIPAETKTAFEEFVNCQDPDDNKNYMKITNGNYAEVMEIMGKKLIEILPTATFETLQEMGRTGVPDIIHIKGLPIDSIIPYEGTIEERVNQKGKISENLILGIANVMGCEAKANGNEQEGRIIHNVAPKNGASKVSSLGVNSLYWHTENAYEETPPDFLMLYGLVADESVPTGYSSIEDFLKNFDEQERDLMRVPHFRICAEPGYSESQGIFALLSTNGDKTRLRVHDYSQVEYVGEGERDKKEIVSALLKKMFEILREKLPEEILINPGEAIVFNNGWRIGQNAGGVMHCRGNDIKNQQRWLQRGYFHKKPEDNGK